MGLKGKYFVIVNRTTGLVFDVKAGSHDPGASVIMWPRTGNDNQIWYQDPLSGTIRSKHNNLCLDINDSNRLIVNNYSAGRDSQRWFYDKSRKTIANRADEEKALDVVGESTKEGTEVCSWTFQDKDNQKWKMEALEPRFFYIKSAMHGKVLDIEACNACCGARIIMFDQKGENSDNQLWFEDKYGNIRSKLNKKLVVEATSDSCCTGEFSDGNPNQFWCVHGDHIVNRSDHNKVLDIIGANEDSGAGLCAWDNNGQNNQKWHVEYV